MAVTKNDQHETKPQHEAHSEAKTSDAASPKHVLMEGTGGIKVVRFTVNGQVKSLNLPVSGAELHRVAGSPAKLTLGGKAVPNTIDPLDLADDAEVTATY